jgi:nickel-dependent lactate racemase
MHKTYAARGGASLDLSDGELDDLFSRSLSRALDDINDSRPVIILPPDGTRIHSRAGFLTDIACRNLSHYSNERLGAIMPALGSHSPMSVEEIRRMFPGSPVEKFRRHDWRRDVIELGRLEADWVEQASAGVVRYDWPVQVNRDLGTGRFLGDAGTYSLIISIGQVVPHGVAGMANHTKNLFVGTGGKEAIDKSHYAGALYGQERIMGRTETPVRALFDEGFRRFGNLLPPVLWVLTVVGIRTDEEAAAAGKPRGSPVVRGFFAGFGRECFEKAAALSREVNVELLDEPIQKAVVYLQPEEFRTTWLGNKAIYGTCMAMADGGELLILGPGLEGFGEDPGNDALIRKHGYRPANVIQERVASDPELADGLSAAAHLIHGSPDGRFCVRYCSGPGLSRSEIESVGYEWGNLDEALARYNIDTLKFGWNTLNDGERIFFIPHPTLGLWAERDKFLNQ